MGDEGAHAELGGEHVGLAVVRLGPFLVRRVRCQRDGAAQTETSASRPRSPLAWTTSTAFNAIRFASSGAPEAEAEKLGDAAAFGGRVHMPQRSEAAGQHEDEKNQEH